MTGYWDIVIVLAIAGVMLLILDVRISRAFVAHEGRERLLWAESMLTVDGTAAALKDALRHVREMQVETTLQKVAVANLADEVRMHSGRLGAIEERVMRAALTVPHTHHREGDER